ncbi:MAG: SurA N-terminal domain-containing protein [Desulfobacterales bacterium]|jgi:peptidyl-prolyl cis-trans isomerase D
MLSLMRKHAGSWIIKFLLGAVIIAFIPFGYGLYQQKGEGKVASVDGEPIVYGEYRQIYNNLLDQMRQNFGNSLTDDMINSLGLKDRALNQLIEHKLMLAEADRLGFRVSDQEVADAIRKIEVFQSGGVFDSRRYEYILSRNRISKEDFETQQKESMLVNKLRSFVADNLKVSDVEALEWYKWSNLSVNVEFVLFNPAKYTGIEPSDQEIETFYDENKPSYKKQAQVKARYVFFAPQTYENRVTVSEDEVQQYYETHKEEFHTPKTVEARHILLRVEKDAEPQDVAKARTKALDIFKMAEENKDFAELAKKYSEGPSKAQGGYLGAFKHEDMVEPFSNKAFSMKAGQISEPVRTQFGWHIIKVEKINEAATTSFKEAKKQIQEKITLEKAKTIAYDEAEAVYDESFEGDDLIISASQRDLQVQTTEFFSRQSPIKGIKNRSKFAAAAFSLDLMEISEIQDLNDGFCILQVIEKTPERIAELDEVKAKVKTDLIKKKQEEKALQDANTLISALKNGGSLTSEAGQFGLKPEDTGFFTRSGTIPKIGYDGAVTEAAFKLSKERNLPEKPVKGQKGYYVIQFKDSKEASKEGFDKERLAIKQNLLQQKKFKTLSAWLADLRSNSKIKIQRELL